MLYMIVLNSQCCLRVCVTLSVLWYICVVVCMLCVIACYELCKQLLACQLHNVSHHNHPQSSHMWLHVMSHMYMPSSSNPDDVTEQVNMVCYDVVVSHNMQCVNICVFDLCEVAWSTLSHIGDNIRHMHTRMPAHIVMHGNTTCDTLQHFNVVGEHWHYVIQTYTL